MQLNASSAGQAPDGAAPGGWRAPSVESLTELVHRFYADVRADALLGPVFEEALRDRWEPHLARMVDFWCTVALGSKSFRGNVFNKHMALQGVTPAHFAAWVRLWGEQTERLFAPEVAHDLQVTAHGIARNLFLGYFGTVPEFGRQASSHPAAAEAAHP
jgi:hemoglobin